MRIFPFFLASLTLPALAQTPVAAPVTAASPTATDTKSPPTTTLSVDARLVNLPVVVRDKKGALIQTLTKDDFSLEVDHHPQTIRYFDKDSDLPLTLGLLVDTSESQRSVIDDEREASSAFIDQMLRTDKDTAFVIQFAKSVELLEDTTNSKPKLQAALKEIGTPAPGSNSSDDSNGSGTASDTSADSRGRTHHSGGGTTLYDSVFLSTDELMSKQKGRKAIIVLSDGNDRGSKERLTDAIEASQRADTIVYAIYFKGQGFGNRDDFNDSNRRPGGMGRGGGYPGGGYPGGGGGYPRGGGSGGPGGGGSQADGKKTLERMARETGGRLFEVSKKQTTAQIYAQIAEELRAQYRLGYTPDAAEASDGYHRIDLALTKSDSKNLIVQTRDGYYSGK
jgi:VWFA-related protein